MKEGKPLGFETRARRPGEDRIRFVGPELVGFYEELIDRVPPGGDPYLASWPSPTGGRSGSGSSSTAREPGPSRRR